MRNIVTVLAILLAFSVQAQEDTLLTNTGKIQINASIGWYKNTTLENVVSPMLYSGGGIAFGTGLRIDRDISFDQFSMTYQQAGINPNLKNDSRADLYRGQAEWIRAYRLTRLNQSVGIFAGGQLLAGTSVLSHEQWSNNGQSYCFALSLGPGFSIDIPGIGRKENLRLKWDMSLPLITYVIRPGISSLLPEGAIKIGNTDKLGLAFGGEITSLHQYLNLRSRVCMEIDITSSIGLQMEYFWDYQQYNVNNDYKSANHILSAGISYRIHRDEK